MVDRTDREESIAMEAKYDGIAMILNELEDEVIFRKIETQDEFIDLIVEFRNDYFGDEENDNADGSTDGKP